MITRFSVKEIFLVLCIGVVGFQESLSQSGRDDAFITPVITDEMTMDPDQNQRWRSGRYPFPARPKDAWEVGIHMGHFVIHGDVNPALPAGLGFGLHVRKALFYTLSFRVSVFHGVTSGMDARRSPGSTIALDIPGFPVEASLYRNFRTSFTYGSFESILNIGNLLFHSERSIWNLYFHTGVGFNTYNVKIDAFDGDGNPYDYSGINGNPNSRADRREIRRQLREIHNGDYETTGRTKDGKWYISEGIRLQPHISLGFGVSRKFNKRFNLSLEHQAIFMDDDLIDGFVYRTTLDQSNQNDVPHYTNLRLAINLGDFSRRTEPLYWLNPLAHPLGDIAELRARPRMDIADIDTEDLLRLLDDEPDVHPGSVIDTRPGQRPGDFPAPGTRPPGTVIPIPGPGITEEDVLAIINNKLEGMRMEWYLPMIHFGSNSYYIRPEYYPQLHSVATVMQMHPELQIVVTGHSDDRASSDYNNVLSYRRAEEVADNLSRRYNIPRSRLIINYGGSNLPLTEGVDETDEIREVLEFVNRRVEFRIALPGDREMSPPSGPDAGTKEPETRFKGDRQSGY